MENIINKLEPKDWLELNAKLQQKKSALREELATRGILKREGNNAYDKYKYFSEAQYKALFTELLPKHKLELNFDEVQYDTFEVSGKQPNGRMPKLKFYLYDIDSGFFETTVITGEGIDKGDKAGYKAYTGALKYYLANKFMVATGDDPETESPDGRAYQYAQPAVPLVDAEAVKKLQQLAGEAGISEERICSTFHVEKLSELNIEEWNKAIKMLRVDLERRGGAA